MENVVQLNMCAVAEEIDRSAKDAARMLAFRPTATRNF
jgi:hypothetical protein